MGGTCSRLVSVKTSKAFKNKVHTLPLPRDEPEEVEGNQAKPIIDNNLEDKNIERVIKEKGEPTVELEPPDIFSKGDHYRENSEQIDANTTRAEHYALIQHELAQGDYRIDEKPETNDSQNNIIQVEENSKLRGASPKIEEKQNMASQVDGNTDITDGSKDSNDNSYNRHQIESQTKYNIDVNGLDSSNCDVTEDNDVPPTPRDAVKPEDKEVEEKRDVSPDFNCIPQDSLFFLPLDGDQQRPPAPCKIPERLSRSRNLPPVAGVPFHKPPLSYSERMLLADCNRFQQLDKKREFAVRRNRSISRLGKLPKIGDSKGESSDGSDCKISNTLNKPDD